jgi:hypothetical protein
VLMPPAWAQADGSEPSASQTELLLEPKAATTVRVRLRFLQLQTRADGDESWDEGVEQQVDAALELDDLLGAEREILFHVAGANPGGQGLSRRPLSGLLSAVAERLPGPYGLVKLRLRVHNTTPWHAPGVPRQEALRHALVAAHTLVAAEGGAFVSQLDPPEWARPAVAGCDNRHTFPVLLGEEGRQDLVLSSPIILYDYPSVAPESQGDLFDATEIDEILTLRTLTLTDEEKREARATDPRAAAIIDRVDTLPPELLDRLHGAMRSLRDPGTASERAAAASGDSGGQPAGAPDGTAPGVPAFGQPEPGVPWWDPAADTSVSPETDTVEVAGVAIGKGSRVRLRPGSRRADAQDLFLADRVATVEAVLADVDGNRHLAVTLDGDPAVDLQRWHGRYLYFAPDELEPL